jgi:hypothetical protein
MTFPDYLFTLAGLVGCGLLLLLIGWLIFDRDEEDR